jgi:hypothetical protein|tara:strand:+ start:808 stop:1098 length:291 start_codon:yes stop_codon:yes gene_type:complete
VNNFRPKKQERNKSWPYIPQANKLSFLNDKVNIKHNLFDLVGQTAFAAYEGKLPNKFGSILDKARLDIDIDFEKGYNLDIKYGKDDYKINLSKDIF